MIVLFSYQEEILAESGSVIHSLLVRGQYMF